MATYQVRIDADGEKVLSNPLSGLEGGIATENAPGVVQPDGKTVRVDNTGVLSAIGGNLLLNSEELITESGEWVAPVSGWFEILLYDGGNSGSISNYGTVSAGASGSIRRAMVYLTAGQSVPVVVGAGGVSPAKGANINIGGNTSFGDISTASACIFGFTTNQVVDATLSQAGTATIYATGCGHGGGYPAQSPAGSSQEQRNKDCNALGYWGGGGAAVRFYDGNYGIGAGAPGSVYVRWHDPAKAAGPVE